MKAFAKCDNNPYSLLSRKVLKGAKPSDLPVEQPTSEDCAKALGLTNANTAGMSAAGES